MSTESPLVIHTGSLLDNLDQETQARVLELRYMRHPLVEAKTPFAKKIQVRLNEVGYYDLNLGCFVRTKITAGRTKLGAMGYTAGGGYIEITVRSMAFKRSHLVYLWFTGLFPRTGEEIDHIDGNVHNDYPGNLRIVSRELNCRNARMREDNKSGYTGVFYHKSKKKYEASIKVNKKSIYLGRFSTAEAAAEARTAWLQCNPNYGFTTRHGT